MYEYRIAEKSDRLSLIYTMFVTCTAEGGDSGSEAGDVGEGGEDDKAGGDQDVPELQQEKRNSSLVLRLFP